MKKIKLQKQHSLLLLLILSFLISCSSIPKNPNGIENGCDILNRHDTWEEAFNNTYKEYGVPPQVIMAFIYQESKFIHNARPKRRTFLGIPTTRPSNAYGFPQALDNTWKWYKERTGRTGADRDNLPDSVRFVGWYINENQKRTAVSKWDTAKQYLAYHEGTGGYLKKTYLKKPWLIKVSDKVARRAGKYRQDLEGCFAN